MEQEAADELDGIQGHDLGSTAVSVVLAVKADPSVFQSSKPVVGDSHPVGVASQILENALGTAEGRFGVNHPFVADGLLTRCRSHTGGPATSWQPR